MILVIFFFFFLITNYIVIPTYIYIIEHMRMKSSDVNSDIPFDIQNNITTF